MVVTQRRNRADPAKPEARAGIEPGIKITCDFCHLDITHSTVRFKCADPICEDIDVCPSCFCEGREGQRHKAWHDYRVEEYLSTPIFSPDWGADEELLLISGLIIYGLGNWLEVAGYIGTRTKEDCEQHYYEVFLGVGLDGKELDQVKKEHEGVRLENGESKQKAEERKRKREFMPIDQEDWQTRKKARIEEMRKPQTLPPPSGPLVSAPTNHEVAGFMPGRVEFEHEVENEAEMAVKDMEFGLVWRYGGDEQPESKAAPVVEETGDDDDDEEKGDKEEEADKKARPKQEKAEEEDIKPDITAVEAGTDTAGNARGDAGSSDKGKGKAVDAPGFEVEDEDELDVKLALLEIYLSKLDKREEAKEIIFDRGLTEHKKIQAIERKRARDERDLIQRYKVFAKLQTAQDFEVLTEGLIVEQDVRKRIAELQEYRRMGITTAAEAEVYDQAKIARAGYKPIGAAPRERIDAIISGARTNAGQNRFLQGIHGTPPPPDRPSKDVTPKGASRRAAAPLNLANAQSLDLLTYDEQGLCSQLRILPKPYLAIKELYLRENERRRGGLKRRDARKMLKIDVNKSGRIFDFLVMSGTLHLSYDPTVKGIGPGKEGHMIMPNGYGHGHPNGGGETNSAQSHQQQQQYQHIHPRPGLAEVHLPNGNEAR